MDHELTLEQTRDIARMRWRHPGAEVVVHHKRWGLIIEVRRGRRTVELARFDWLDAPPTAEHSLGLAA